MKHLDGLLVLLLAAVFLFAGIDKALHYEGFVNALRSYVLLPKGWAAHLALPLISTEIVLGLGLLVPAWRRPAALAGGALLVLFTAALLIDQRYGGNSICGCWFTFTLAEGTNTHIGLNLILAAMAFILGLEGGRGTASAGTPTGVEA